MAKLAFVAELKAKPGKESEVEAFLEREATLVRAVSSAGCLGRARSSALMNLNDSRGPRRSKYGLAAGSEPIRKDAPWAGSEEKKKWRKNMSGRLKVLTLLLGVWMFLFGFLKFFQPIRGWFEVQIQQSHLPHEAILAGKLSEMLTGVLFLLPWLRRSLTAKSRNQILLAASSLLVVQMFVAIYVHLQPGVPASVLPLGIKPPVIPVVVLLLGLFTASDVWKHLRAERA